MVSFLRIVTILVFSILFSACTHLHNDLISTEYTQKKTIYIENKEPNIQIIVTRGPFYFTHSAIRIRSKKRILFWDPSGSYADDEHTEFFREHPLPDGFSKKNALIVNGIPSLETYWIFAQYTADSGMEIFEWALTDDVARRYQSILLAGSEEGDNKYDFASQDIFLLCSSALSRFVNRFVFETFSLGETYFFPDSLAHKLYTLNPDRIILFEKGGDTQVFWR